MTVARREIIGTNQRTLRAQCIYAGIESIHACSGIHNTCVLSLLHLYSKMPLADGDECLYTHTILGNVCQNEPAYQWLTDYETNECYF